MYLKKLFPLLRDTVTVLFSSTVIFMQSILDEKLTFQNKTLNIFFLAVAYSLFLITISSNLREENPQEEPNKNNFLYLSLNAMGFCLTSMFFVLYSSRMMEFQLSPIATYLPFVCYVASVISMLFPHFPSLPEPIRKRATNIVVGTVFSLGYLALFCIPSVIITFFIYKLTDYPNEFIQHASVFFGVFSMTIIFKEGFDKHSPQKTSAI